MPGQASNTHGFTCATCEIPIAGPAVFHIGLPFCCAGCAADGPCGCSYDEPALDRVDGRSMLRPLGADVLRVARRRSAEPDPDAVPTPIEPPAPSAPAAPERVLAAR